MSGHYRAAIERCLSVVEPTIFDVAQFGADPTAARDSAPAVAHVLRLAAAEPGPVEVRFPTGRYRFDPEGAERRDLYVSNTVGEDPRHVTKTIGLLLENAAEVTIDGGGSLFEFHGRQTVFAALGSRDIELRGFAVDFVTPAVVEATVTATGVDEGRAWRDLLVPPGTRFRVEGASVVWEGELGTDGEPYWSGRDSMGYTQAHDPASRRTWRTDDILFTDAATITATGPRSLRIVYRHGERSADLGFVYQMRDTVRDHPGGLIAESDDVRLVDLDIHYLHGFGIVGQLSRDLTLRRVRFRARPGSGRTTASAADFLNLSSIAGAVVVEDCVFDGAHDDAINLHGTYLAVEELLGPRSARLAYRHRETAGFAAFHPGDEVAFVRGDLLDPDTEFRTRVVAVDGPDGRSTTHDLRRMTLELADDLPPELGESGWVAENLTYTARLTVERCTFVNIPTRGILVTTRQPVVIRDNEFDGMTMPSISISCDAADWFESGPVLDALITANRFLRPATPAIDIAPTSTADGTRHPVHRGIRIVGNEFRDARAPIVAARSVRGLEVTGNRVPDAGGSAGGIVELRECTDVVLDG
jgi:hypothetical protein